MAEAAEYVLAAQNRREVSGGRLYPWHGRVCVRVINNFSDLSKFQRGAVCVLHEPLLKPETEPDTYWTDQNLMAVVQGGSALEIDLRFVVLDDVSHIGDVGDIGWAIFQGFAWADVNIRSNLHQRCTPTWSSEYGFHLQSDFWGRGLIVWSPGGTGFQKCLIHLGEFYSGVYLAVVKNSDVPPRSLATLDIGYFEFTVWNNLNGTIKKDHTVAVYRGPGDTVPSICGYWRDPPN